MRSYQKNKTIWTKNEDVTEIYDYRYIKTKIKTYDDKVYINFRGFNVPEDDTECKSFKVVSVDLLLVYESKHYL